MHPAPGMKAHPASESPVSLTSVLDFIEEATTPAPITLPIRRALKRFTHRTGINQVVAGGRSGAAVVLYFHKVQRRPTGLWGESALSVEAFEAQVRFIAENYRPMALSELVARLREGRPIPDRTVVLTFDDGYRNNLVLAAPVLRRWGVPATLFIPTGLIGTDQWMWGYELEEMFLRQPVAALSEECGNAQFRQLCALGFSRHSTALACVQLLKMLPDAEKEAVLGRLRRRFAVEVDDENRFLSWDEVRAIREYGVEIGAHTVTHPLLNRVSLAHAEREMTESRQRLEAELGEPVRLFAYPNGNATPELEALSERHFDAAVTTTAGAVMASSHVSALPRVCAPDTEVDLSYELTKYFLSADPWRAFAG